MSKIYIEFSSDLQWLLEENQLSIQDLLAHAGIDQQVTYEARPYQVEEGARTKELVSVILVSAAAFVLATGYALSQVISTLQRKPSLVEIEQLEEVRDAQGSVLIDTQGQPVLKTVKTVELLEPRKENREREFELHFDPKKDFVIKVRSGEKQLLEQGPDVPEKALESQE